MENQFNTLLESYRSNYVQHGITGDDKYKTAYLSAKQGLDSLLKGMSSLDTHNPQPDELRNDILRYTEAKMRDAKSMTIKNVAGFTTTQYTVIGVLGGLICLLYII
jgi:hypothetical protein